MAAGLQFHFDRAVDLAIDKSDFSEHAFPSRVKEVLEKVMPAVKNWIKEIRVEVRSANEAERKRGYDCEQRAVLKAFKAQAAYNAS